MAGHQNTPVPKKRRRRRGRREKSLAGTNLFREVRTDKLVWRKTHPITKRRITRSTGTDVLEYALIKAKEFNDELEREVAGIKNYDGWTRELAPLVSEWFSDQRNQDTPPQEVWLKQKESVVRRALKQLRLERAADLTDVGKLDMRLKALGKPDATLRRRYQDPLKQFSQWLAENCRYLERDPLLVWKTISYEAEEKHRAYGPDEVARALVAADWLDRINGRDHTLRPVFTVLLVTASRIAAFASRDVEHYLAGEGRIDFGRGRGKKGRGQGKLDPTTDAELRAYLADRVRGPLFLSPRGCRLIKRNALRWWQEAFGLGLVWELWPEADWDVELGHLVNQTLISGSVRIRAAGNPRRLKDDTKRKRKKLKGRVGAIAEALRDQWEARMHRVTLHSFRHTHETWARALGVDQVLINLQVGWRVSGRHGDALEVRRIASTTGLSRYLDAQSKLLDARKSAAAVRGLLDEAQARVEQQRGARSA